MKFFSIVLIVAILVLCLTSSTEAGFGKKFKKALHKVEHHIDSAGQHLANTIHKTAGAAADVGKILAVGGAVKVIAG